MQERKETLKFYSKSRRAFGKAPLLLAVSFGTACPDSWDAEIGILEHAIAGRFPEYELRRAFSSRKIIHAIQARHGLSVEHVTQALERAVRDGFRQAVIQPFYFSDGYEYAALQKVMQNYQDSFAQAVCGSPLLTSDADLDAVARALVKSTAGFDDGKTAFCFMGHGTCRTAEQALQTGSGKSHETEKAPHMEEKTLQTGSGKSHETEETPHMEREIAPGSKIAPYTIYEKLQARLTQEGHGHCYIGTMKEAPSLQDMKQKLLRHGGYKRIVLSPLLITAGWHVREDMAGEKEHSWKNMLKKEGYEVICHLEGLGRNPDIQRIFASHVKAAAESLRIK